MGSLYLFVLLLQAIFASPEPLDAPETAGLKIESRNKDCIFTTDFKNGPGPNSTLQLSYLESPFESNSASSSSSKTCRLVLEFAFPAENYTVTVQGANFKGNLNGHHTQAAIDMKAVWEHRTGLVR